MDKKPNWRIEFEGIARSLVYKQKDMNLEDAYTFTSKVMTENMLHDDSKEGIEAFLEKREPNWKE